MKHLKIAVLCLFALFLAAAFIVPGEMVERAEASSAGPPPGFSGAPDENNCTACHVGPSNNGQFAILDAPVTYKPGQVYQLRVRHVNADTTRKRWGFQMTALAGPLGAGDFINITTNTQVVLDNGRQYVQHTSAGTFAGQTGGAEWPISWTAPPTSVGPVSMYAAGNQANQGTGPDGDQIYTASLTMLAPRPNLFDFDGDAKTDIGIYRPNGANGAEWWYLKSSNGGSFATQFGTASDTIAAADYTGDGKADIAFWRPSTGFWYVLRSEDLTYFAVPFGANGDVPAPSDFDADGKADVAVFRPSTATWFIANSTGNTTIQQFGQAGDLPVPADYDGDGRSARSRINSGHPRTRPWRVILPATARRTRHSGGLRRASGTCCGAKICRSMLSRSAPRPTFRHPAITMATVKRTPVFSARRTRPGTSTARPRAC
jgi:hypothetical protein